jgi:MHS family proline/betaine transporter-like MFS transporter
MRPLGGILFGHIGDRYGRRPALALSILLVTIPTLVIGLLPTYAQIGIIAPIILVICRLLQGLCVGGEYSGAAIFVIEHSRKGQEAFAGSILAATGFFGGFIGTILGALCTLPSMPSWGWRIPFLIGTFIGIIGYYIRTHVDESPAFSQLQQTKALIRAPLKKVILTKTRNLLCTLGIGAQALVPLYIVTVYLSTLLSQLKIDTSQIMVFNSMIAILWMVAFPCMGKIADKIGTRKIMATAALAAILVAYPLFYLLAIAPSVQSILFIQIILSLAGAAFAAPSATLLTKLFPVEERYSGIGFGYALGGALLGGTTPLIVTTLVNWTQSPTAPAFYIMAVGFVGLISVKYATFVEHTEIVYGNTQKELLLRTS